MIKKVGNMVRHWYRAHWFSLQYMDNHKDRRKPDNWKGGMINEMGIAVETMQWAFVGLTSAILAIELRMKKRIDKRTALDTA